MYNQMALEYQRYARNIRDTSVIKIDMCLSSWNLQSCEKEQKKMSKMSKKDNVKG